ncbi:hypothetical protein KCMC57_up45840 [Kitasatospora sp. CMC57]|uniref:Lipoprotein n=1 Tax=Kitasatospora sp. CMC57 TaxID=3231513 RepID=A0AB33K9X9_9ACTN
MTTWLSRTALAWAVVVAAVVAAVSGCGAAGQLHDAGPARPIAAPPSPQLLWAAAETPSVPATEAADTAPPPAALPDITVPGDDLRAVDTLNVLARDPALRGEEQKALTGCQGCAVRSAQYRDLSGDGHPELITAVLVGSETGYLHVYSPRDGRLHPVLAQRVVAGFTAETVGQDLVVREPNGPQDRTVTTYHWSNLRLAVIDRRIIGTGPAAEATLCEPVGPGATVAPTSQPKAGSPKPDNPKAGSPEPKVSVVPTLPPGRGGVAPVPVKPSS